MSTSTVQSEVAPVLSETIKDSTQIVHLEENSNKQITGNNQDANDEGRQNQSTSFLEIPSLKNKPPDILRMGMTTKHSTVTAEIKYNYLQHREEKVPSMFKTGTVSPILKKGKAFYGVENYRGITVTSVIGKVFEYIILNKANLMKSGQSPLQFGFTQGLSPNMAALILSEACSEISGKKTIFVSILDSKKAFDVVSHEILMDRLHVYHYGLNLNLWNIIEELYSGVTSTVKWKGETSTSFDIHQSVRQGGVLSTHLYKAYINELLLDLQKRNLGTHIGNNYVGCPTCADDIVLLSLNREEMQEMLNIVDNYSKDHRFNIHPQKINVIIKTGKK
ncbi:unnamed protein product [Mytilus coruscus]|uniref:Reverse transcriptase domain-containing protein n=1 Tax=Mytilus coruscus TaxID=42192 RepID=A0A6J8BEW2_MYTCO|nr:unnamed protein product [Mytilus coruscus]